MPEGKAHRRCKDVLAQLIHGKPTECLVRKGLRADRCGRLRGRSVYGEADCLQARGAWLCVLSVFDRRSGKLVYRVICREKRRKRNA